VRDQIFSETGESYHRVLPFVYPPVIAAVFSLFAKLPFVNAYYLYLILSLLAGGSMLLILCRDIGILKKHRILIPLMISGFIPFAMNTLMGGQIAWFGIALVSALYLLLRQERDFSAGLVMSLSYYKPPLFLFMLIVLLLWQGKRFWIGFATGGATLIFLSLLFVGWEGCLGFLDAATGYTYGQELAEGVELDRQQGAGIFGMLASLFPKPTIAGSALFFLFMISLFSCWKLKPHTPSANRTPLWFSWVSILSVGLSIQCIRYDLALLLPAFFIMLSCIHKLENRRLVLLLILSTIAFYCEWLMRWGSFSNIQINLSSLLFLLSGVIGGMACMSLSRQDSTHCRKDV